jgi:predicted Holliday junction resolvase-like endonuclease
VEPLLKDVNSEIREVGESLSQASLIECRGGDLKQNIRNDLDRARALKEANEAEESTVEELKKKLAEIEEKLKKRRQDRQAEIHAIMHGKTEQDLLNYFQT